MTSNPKPSFDLLRTDGDARRGRLLTDHGIVQTPAFMPVGTQGSVKGLTVDQLRATGAEMILANTYHLHLRPGSERVLNMGGLHRFMGWEGPILTDSGGFQVFSLAALCDVDDRGVRFRSHIDGSLHELSPETSMEIQSRLGADVVMAFDECPALPSDGKRIREAVDRTLLWADRCVEVFGTRRLHPEGHQQALFGIVQGGLLPEERARCAQRLVELDLAGYAIGGLSVGESKEDMHRVAASTAALLPDDRARYLMGVGFPEDLLAAVAAGVDLFDCVLPTRLARHGTLLSRRGRISLRNARFADDQRPVDPSCSCATCRRHSRAYLRHLIMAGEILGLVLGTLHNVTFYQSLMKEIREAIVAGDFASMRERFLEEYGDGRRRAQ
jgi:queuine tRNA-ribosyltransferase